MHKHTNAISALRAAYQVAPAIVGWGIGGWIVYPATDGAPPGIVPEIFAPALGAMPVSLSETGVGVLHSALNAVCENIYRR